MTAPHTSGRRSKNCASRKVGGAAAALLITLALAGCGPTSTPPVSATARASLPVTPAPTTTASPAIPPTASPTAAPVMGLDWQALPDDPSLRGVELIGITGAPNGMPGLVAVGCHASDMSEPCDGATGSWFSADGRAWTAAKAFPATASDWVTAVISGPLLVAVGTGVWISADGRTWERVLTLPAGEMHQDLQAVTRSANGGYVAVGEEGSGAPPSERDVVWTSSADARHWKRAPASAGFEGDFGLETVVGGPPYLATSEGPSGGPSGARVWNSADGVHWKLGATLPTDTVSELGRVDGGYLAVGVVGDGADQVGVAFTSPDGTHWDPVTIERPQDCWVTGFVEVPGGVVAVGWDQDAGPAAWRGEGAGAWRRAPQQPGWSESALSVGFDGVILTGQTVLAWGSGPDGAALWISPPGSS